MERVLVWIGAILIAIGLLALEWLITCGVIKLICICFSLDFSWKIATGIWFVMLLLKSVFKNSSK